MKKILLLSAVLLGAVTASQAGVRFSFGIPVPGVVVAPPAPVYVAPPAPAYVEPPAPAYVQPPTVYAPAPPVVVAPPVLDFSFGYPGYHRPYYHPYYRGYGWRHDYGYHHRW